MFYIYILYTEAFDKYYVGYTSDITRRLEEHNTIKFNTFTHKYRSWEIAALFEVSENRGTTIKIERFIKKQKSRSIILQLINPAFVPIWELAHPDSYREVRVPHMRD